MRFKLIVANQEAQMGSLKPNCKQTRQKNQKNEKLGPILDISKQFDTRDHNAIFERLNAAATVAPGFKLLTIMELDQPAQLARRSYSSNPTTYPTSGTKPILKTQWFKDVVESQKPFLANSPDQMGDQFPDLDIIESLGCGSIVNVPVVKSGKTVAVINILHETGYFTDQRFKEALALAKFL